MSYSKQSVSASQLAREFGMTIDGFAHQVDELVLKLSAEEARMPAAERHKEVCAAIWAAISAATNASSLSAHDRDRLDPLLQEVLLPYWRKRCLEGSVLADSISELSPGYLKIKDSTSRIITASHIVNQLLEAIGASEAVRPKLIKRLVPLFSHRMIGDIHYIDDVKTRYGIHFPVIVALLATAEIVAWSAPTVRLLQ